MVVGAPGETYPSCTIEMASGFGVNGSSERAAAVPLGPERQTGSLTLPV
jgi:hypothetical protein